LSGGQRSPAGAGLRARGAPWKPLAVTARAHQVLAAPPADAPDRHHHRLHILAIDKPAAELPEKWTYSGLTS